MSSNNSSSSSGGIGFVGLLTIVFIVLKLVPGNPVNDWSWWWVLSPLWITALLIIGILIVGFGVWRNRHRFGRPFNLLQSAIQGLLHFTRVLVALSRLF